MDVGCLAHVTSWTRAIYGKRFPKTRPLTTYNQGRWTHLA